MIGIEPHLGGQVECDGESGDALREQIAIAPVALFGGSETGILPHGPQAAAIHFADRSRGCTETVPAAHRTKAT